MNDRKTAPLENLDRLAAMARQESAPRVAFSPKLYAVIRQQEQEERVQTYFLSGATVAAAAVFFLSLPTLFAGLDPLEALFQIACSPLP